MSELSPIRGTHRSLVALPLLLAFLAACSKSGSPPEPMTKKGADMNAVDESTAKAWGDGVIVLQADAVTYYVPRAWLIGLSGTRVLGSIEPPIEEREEAGRVHHLQPGHGLDLNLRIPGRPVIIPNFPVHSINIRTHVRAAPLPGSESFLREPDALGWSQFGKGSGFVDTRDPSVSVDSPHQADVANGHPKFSTFPNSSSYPFKGTKVIYKWQEPDAPQPQWRNLRKRVGRFLTWLSSPPPDRAVRPHF